MFLFCRWIIKYLYFNYYKKDVVNFKTKVITYHDVSSKFSFNDYTVSVKRFEKQVKLIRDMGYDIISFENIYKLRDERFIVFTFDDGFKGIVEAALILKKYGFSATFFITTGLVGKDGYVDWFDLRRLKRLGFQIASHSHNHRMISDLDCLVSQMEFKKSKELLEYATNDVVDLFAFPYGQINSFNSINIQDLQSIGYNKCFTQIAAHQSRDFLIRNFVIGRSGVKSFYNLKSYEALI